ncbi:hypothetical protein FRX31_026541, partial [Thalictrum thalictroides]
DDEIARNVRVHYDGEWVEDDEREIPGIWSVDDYVEGRFIELGKISGGEIPLNVFDRLIFDNIPNQWGYQMDREGPIVFLIDGFKWEIQDDFDVKMMLKDGEMDDTGFINVFIQLVVGTDLQKTGEEPSGDDEWMTMYTIQDQQPNVAERVTDEPNVEETSVDLLSTPAVTESEIYIDVDPSQNDLVDDESWDIPIATFQKNKKKPRKHKKSVELPGNEELESEMVMPVISEQANIIVEPTNEEPATVEPNEEPENEEPANVEPENEEPAKKGKRKRSTNCGELSEDEYEDLPAINNVPPEVVIDDPVITQLETLQADAEEGYHSEQSDEYFDVEIEPDIHAFENETQELFDEYDGEQPPGYLVGDCLKDYPEPYVGQEWPCIAVAREYTRSHAIFTKFEVRFPTNDGDRLQAKCVSWEDCPWRFWGSCSHAVKKDKKTLTCKRFVGEHSVKCRGNQDFKNSQATSDWVAQKLELEVRRHHKSYTPFDIVEDAWAKYE